MQAHRTEAVLSEDGVVTVRDLPFRKGDPVEVIVLPRPIGSAVEAASSFPLHGTPFTLLDPFEPVAEDHWDVAR
jgi:hypothetical protein